MFNKTHPFKNKFVSIVQKSTLNSKMDFQDGGPDATAEIPMVHEGYFIQEDKDFIYLADKYNQKRISIAVHKTDISYIEMNGQYRSDDHKLTYLVDNNSEYEN